MPLLLSGNQMEAYTRRLMNETNLTGSQQTGALVNKELNSRDKYSSTYQFLNGIIRI